MTWRAEDGGPGAADRSRRRARSPTGRRRSTSRPAPRRRPRWSSAASPASCSCCATRRATARSSLVEQHRPAARSSRSPQSPELAGGPVWPGGVGAHDNGSLYVVFGNHAHRLDASLRVLASRDAAARACRTTASSCCPTATSSPRTSAVRARASRAPPSEREPCELRRARTRASSRSSTALELPEPSIARLSADGDDVYVVGDTSLLRVRWDGHALALDDAFTARYRTPRRPDLRVGLRDRRRRGVVPRQRRRQRAVQRDAPRPRRLDRAAAPRAGRPRDRRGDDGRDLRPARRPRRQPAGRRRAPARRRRLRQRQRRDRRVRPRRASTPRWRRDQDHASHLLLFARHGRARHRRPTRGRRRRSTSRPATSSPASTPGARCSRCCSPTPGFDRDVYVCSFLTISRVAVSA